MATAMLTLWQARAIGLLIAADRRIADALIDLAYAPKQTYRQNGRFVMNRATEAAVRKLKDGDGNYLWQPAASAGAPATLLGYRVLRIPTGFATDNYLSQIIAFLKSL